jgi:hypothetical protein
MMFYIAVDRYVTEVKYTGIQSISNLMPHYIKHLVHNLLQDLQQIAEDIINFITIVTENKKSLPRGLVLYQASPLNFFNRSK